MKFAALTGLMTGVLLLLAAIYQASMGWAHVSRILERMSAADSLTQLVSVSWAFSIASLAGFGLIIIFKSWEKLIRKKIRGVTLSIIGVTFCLFALWCFWWVNQPITAGFMFVTGLLCMAAAALGGRSGGYPVGGSSSSAKRRS